MNEFLNMENISDVNSEKTEIIEHNVFRISDYLAVNEMIQEYKNNFNKAVENSSETIENLKERILENISDYYFDIQDLYLNEDKTAIEFPKMAQLDEGITENRDFGLERCTEAALEIFNPGVINEWKNMTAEEKMNIAYAYAEEVAKAFELENYSGLIIEPMDANTGGYNLGDGYIHLNDLLFNETVSPLQILDTITHELRHQYQSECIAGYHDVSDEVRNEWSLANDIYGYDYPSAYDPWGYQYNPLEIDSRYAGETVVRNVTSQMINDAINLTNAMNFNA